MPTMASDVGYVPFSRAQVFCFGGFISSLFVLSSRYYTCAAYERPIHLGILVLIETALISLAFSRYSNSNRHPQWQSLSPTPSTTSLKVVPKERLLQLLKSCMSSIRSAPLLFCIAVGCMVVRILLFWVLVRTTQCTILGVEAFLPFVVLLPDAFNFFLDPSSQQIIRHPIKTLRQHGFILVHSLIAFLWGVATMFALDRFTTRTGAVCPPSWQWRHLILAAQVLACFIDALLLVNLRLLHDARVKKQTDSSISAALVLFSSAFMTFILVFFTLLEDSDLFWAFCPPFKDSMDLIIESLLTTATILCAFSLLESVHPSILALSISSLLLFGYHFPTGRFNVLLPLSRPSDLLSIQLTLAILFWTLWCFELHPTRKLEFSAISHKQRWIAVAILGIYVLSILIGLLLSDSATKSLSQAVKELTAGANVISTNWEAQAAWSQTLRQAVENYKTKYGLLPPPNFDKWYQFALANGSPVIDDFTQIHNDLLPFWSLEPSTIRQRTSHLAEHSGLGISLLRIRNGTCDYSPNIPGSHRWMMDSMQRMVEPFVKWLPDMDVAMNLGDECRMAIPFEEMREHKYVARKAMANMMRPGNRLQNSTTMNLNGSQWPSSWSAPLPNKVPSPFFSDYIRWQIYHDLVSPSCPPQSLARRKRWWDWSTLCVECMIPHTIFTEEGSLVADFSLAKDLCHQPDIAHLNGFIMSPAAMLGTNKLFPIFSQGRVGGFSDIMIPSPWNFDKKSLYNESLDRAWEDKSEALFWRGSSSDGYAAYNSWMGFLRARFGNEAYQRAMATEPTVDEETLKINVSFAGTISKCHQVDCDTELHTFNKWAKDMHLASGEINNDETVRRLSTKIAPFEDNWNFRHLIDMDGAGFSGRFLPFLKSHSLVYRAGIFQAWFDERLTAWQHYVPIDIRLGSGAWALFDFFSGKGHKDGREHAQKIAEQGRTWALKALRPEDMQIYMFRLLLEWGRVVDDDREHLGLVSEVDTL